jgi:hypothetical protein
MMRGRPPALTAEDRFTGRNTTMQVAFPVDPAVEYP